MGADLSRVTAKCLPYPKNPDEFTDLGFEFYEKREDGVMCKAKLPDGWGLFCDSSRGDIEYFSIVDDTGRDRVSIMWVSKGAYDNEARMTLQDGNRVLDIDNLVLENGQYFRKELTDLQKYQDLCNICFSAHTACIGEFNDRAKDLLKQVQANPIHQTENRVCLEEAIESIKKHPNNGLQASGTLVYISDREAWIKK